MKAKEVCDILAREFPDLFVSYEVECCYHGRGLFPTKNKTVEATIYTEETGPLDCAGIFDGIHKLKIALGKISANPDVPDVKGEKSDV